VQDRGRSAKQVLADYTSPLERNTYAWGFSRKGEEVATWGREGARGPPKGVLIFFRGDGVAQGLTKLFIFKTKEDGVGGGGEGF